MFNVIFLIGEDKKVLTLAPLSIDSILPHTTAFINELKLSDFKQILLRNNVPSEFSGGVLWCSNGTLALRRVSHFVYIDSI